MQYCPVATLFLANRKLANMISAHKRSIFPYFDEFGNSENRSSFA